MPFAPINGIDAVVEDPQVGHLGLDRAGRTARSRAAARPCVPPLQFDGERARAVVAAPLLDQHGAAIRAARHATAGIGRRRGAAAPRTG